ncbi:uncharacterized protein LOC129124758 isoform X3 [Agelaius phoeniceus]|uniref:uncharacterized protein LOC129124758 isoform X3 n=1 Tax=Agelaius phoeniceus TaxID=39638 RepID=UPI004054BCC3
MEGGEGKALPGAPRVEADKGRTMPPPPARLGSAPLGAERPPLCSPRRRGAIRAAPRQPRHRHRRSGSPSARPPSRPGGAGTCVRWPRCLRAAAPLRRVRRSGAARLAAPSRRKRVPFSQKKHPTALSPPLPVPAPGPWLSAFLLGPPGDWTLEPVPLCQALGTGLLPEPSAAGGGNAGAWSGRCLGGWDIPALPCRLPSAIHGTGKSRWQREDKGLKKTLGQIPSLATTCGNVLRWHESQERVTVFAPM